MIELFQNNSWTFSSILIAGIALVAILAMLFLFFLGEDEQPEQAQKTVEEVAVEVMAGFWGNGDERKSRLESAGYDYEEIQNQVNQYIELMNKNQ